MLADNMEDVQIVAIGLYHHHVVTLEAFATALAQATVQEQHGLLQRCGKRQQQFKNFYFFPPQLPLVKVLVF